MRYKFFYFSIIIVFAALGGLLFMIPLIFRMSFLDGLIEELGGGPIGAFLGSVGGGLGGALGQRISETVLGFQPTAMEIRQVNSKAGIHLSIRCHRKYKESLGFVATLSDEAKSLPLQSTFFIRNGFNSFVLFGPFHKDPNDPKVSVADLFIPYGAVRAMSDTLVLRVDILESQREEPYTVGTSSATFQWQNREGDPSKIMLEPLIGLMLHIAHQSGGLSMLRERRIYDELYYVFDIDPPKDPTVQALLNQGPQYSVRDYVHQLRARLPMLTLDYTCLRLASICDIDGRLPPSTLDVLREVALAWGGSDEEWQAFAKESGLFYARDLYLEAYDALQPKSHQLEA